MHGLYLYLSILLCFLLLFPHLYLSAFIVHQDNSIYPSEVEYLVIAGGGGTIKNEAGGGAGGVLQGIYSPILKNIPIVISVGRGGISNGISGEDSSFGDIIAIGGGASASSSSSNMNGMNGGSGGVGGSTSTTTGHGGSGIEGQGQKGGNAQCSGVNC